MKFFTSLLAQLATVLLCATANAADLYSGATLVIHVRGIRAVEGNILVSGFNDPAAFPNDVSKAAFKLKVPVTSGEAVITLKNLAIGDYAIAVVHDENSNDQMDKNGIGFPKEDFGFSNDAMGTFGPPSFKKAKVQVAAPGTEIIINLKHF